MAFYYDVPVKRAVPRFANPFAARRIKGITGCLEKFVDVPAPPDRPSSCDSISIGSAFATGAPVALPHLGCSERYLDLVSCTSGASLLLSRVETRISGSTIHADVWSSALRLQGPAATSFSAPSIALNPEANMSHNTALVCLPNGSVVAYGGRRKAVFRAHPYLERGIYRSVGRLVGGRVEWSPRELVIDGEPRTGCKEARSQLQYTCEFDGKLSVVRHRGYFHLFARANLAQCGGRYVQTTRSTDGVHWSQWSLVSIEGVEVSELTNIYYFAVSQVGDQLVGLFPGVVEGFGPGVFFTTSDDGSRWRRPVRLMQSVMYPEGRTRDHPVDGIDVRDGRLALHIVRGVQLDHGKPLEQCARPPVVCRYEMNASTLLHAYAAAAAAPPTAKLAARSAAASRESAQAAEDQLQAAAARLYRIKQERQERRGRGLDFARRQPGRVLTPLKLAPITPAACGTASERPRLALVLRGQPFRWGCSDTAVRHQQQVLSSLSEHLVRRTEAEGECVDIFVAANGSPCGELRLDSLMQPLFASRIAAQEAVQASNQAEAVAAAITLFRTKSRGRTYQRMLLSRLDVRLKLPIDEWGCDASRLGVASKCEQAAWKKYRCVSDILFSVPHRLFGPFFAALGSHGGRSGNPDGQCGCFSATCPGRNTQFSGHDCYNVFRAHMPEENMTACWPPPRHFIGEANNYFELPQCRDVDPAAPYSSRACRRESKSKRLPARDPSSTKHAPRREAAPKRWSKGARGRHRAT